MPSSFQLVGLSPAPFEQLFALSADELEAKGVVRVTADASPGFPCRVSLQDAVVGEELLLLHHEHQPNPSPYRSSGAIFVRARARRAELAPGEIPSYVSSRPISVRAYDARHMMRAAELSRGDDVGPAIERLLADADIGYIHLHNANQGCFSCLVERVPSGACET